MIYQYTALFGIGVIVLTLAAAMVIDSSFRNGKLITSRNWWRDRCYRFDESVQQLRYQLADLQCPEQYRFHRMPNSLDVIRRCAPMGDVWLGDIRQSVIEQYQFQTLSYRIDLSLAMSKEVYPELIARKIAREVERAVIDHWAKQSLIAVSPDGTVQQRKVD